MALQLPITPLLLRTEMDPISIIGTVVGLACACAQTAAVIKSTVSRSNEQAHETLCSIYDVVAPVKGALEELEKSIGAYHNFANEPSLQGQIIYTVAACKSTLELLQLEMDQLGATGEGHFRLKFRLLRGKKSNIDGLLDKLQQSKANLSLLLQTFTAYALNPRGSPLG